MNTLQLYAANQVRAALRDSAAPAQDSLERVEYRMAIILRGAYDRPTEEEPEQPLRDLLTDILHVFDLHGWSFEEALERAYWMRDEERREWGLS